MRLSGSGQSGVSLVSVMVALGLVGILATIMNKQMGNIFKAQSRSEASSDRLALKNMFLDPKMQTAICSGTMPTGLCVPGTLMAVTQKKPDGTTSLLATNLGAGTQFGKFTVRAECNGTGDGLIFRAAQLTSTGKLNSTAATDFRPDPLTQKVVTWADNASLLTTGLAMCLNSSASPSPSPSCPPGGSFCDVPDGNYIMVTGSLVRKPAMGGCSAKPADRHWVGSVTCPTGYRVTGGGAQCQIGLGGWGGVTLSSVAFSDATGWSVDCCVGESAGIAPSPAKGQVYAICIKPSP